MRTGSGRSVGRSPAADIRIADDGEIEIAGDFLLREYWDNPQATAEVFTSDGYLRTGDLGSIDDDGYVSITGRKKDIIITAGGKNLTPANLEGDLRRSRWISQVVMFGDRKPYPVAIVTLDAEVVVPWAEANGFPADLASLARHEQVVAMIQEELDAANARYARVEQIKRFKVLDRDFTIDSGELTPSLKLKRNVVYANLAEEFERLYAVTDRRAVCRSAEQRDNPVADAWCATDDGAVRSRVAVRSQDSGGGHSMIDRGASATSAVGWSRPRRHDRTGRPDRGRPREPA